MSEQPFRARHRPTREDLVRADQVRAEQMAKGLPRRGNNPFMAGPEPERRTYSDPTADEAIGNVDRERRQARGY